VNFGKEPPFRNFIDCPFEGKTEQSIILYGIFESNYLWDEALTLHDGFQATLLSAIEELFNFSK